ncbi:hypothetical protein EZS27_009975 [termite gut metagenome]|jgi:hypothetical protein|uniref:Uncharacterized protein n=1 Tax=termite gut metagenome TaxID=433724 RepID=A0A5J4S9X5_9ZZZZ
MTHTADKHAQICNLFWLPLPDTSVEIFPGVSFIRVPNTTTWKKIDFSTAEFSETGTESGKPVEQEFSATLTDTSESSYNKLLNLFSTYGLLRIDYTNKDPRIVGTNDFPVYISLRRSEKTAVFTLSFKRTSPEYSKFLLTF